MSRSFRHSPVIIQASNERRWIKRLASKAVRRIDVLEPIGNGRKYTRLFPQWDLKEHTDYQLIGKSRFCRVNASWQSGDDYFIPVKVTR